MIEYIVAALIAVSENENLLGKLIGGDFWGAITGVYTGVIGELFLATLFIFIPAGMVYVKTGSFAPSMLILIVGSAVLSGILTTTVRFVMISLAIVGIAAVLYRTMVS